MFRFRLNTFSALYADIHLHVEQLLNEQEGPNNAE